MKKILPVLVISLLLSLMKFNTSIARLLDNQSLEVDLVSLNIDIPDLKVEIYPNPVIDNRISIQANRDIQSIKILSIVGSVIFDNVYQPGTTLVQLDLDKMEKGLYLLKIKFDEETTYTEKIMVH
jgi:hypothetical protein